MTAAAPDPSRGTLFGYVEALTPQEALGWVWCPGRAERLRVELWLGDERLAHALANQSRDDLARNGIGDGHHAFSLAVPDRASARLSELRVLAYPVEGQPVALEPPPPPPPADTTSPLHRGIETLINSQRLLHRNLQAALLQQGPSPTAALAEIAAAQAKLSEAIATVELFVVRLETALQAREAPPAAPKRRLLAATVATSGLAFGMSCWAVYRAVIGG